MAPSASTATSSRTITDHLSNRLQQPRFHNAPKPVQYRIRRAAIPSEHRNRSGVYPYPREDFGLAGELVGEDLDESVFDTVECLSSDRGEIGIGWLELGGRVGVHVP